MKPRNLKPFTIVAFAAFLACSAPAIAGDAQSGIDSEAGPAGVAVPEPETVVERAQADAVVSGRSGGGLDVPGVPVINNVICLSGCTKVRGTTPGGTVQLSGTEMKSVTLVRFSGKSGAVKVKPDLVTKSRVEATVPQDAVSGKVRVKSISGAYSSPSPQTLYVSPASKLVSGKQLKVTDASITAARTFQFGIRKPRLRYVISSGRNKFDLRIDVTNSSGEVVRSMFRREIESGSSQTIAWNGKATGGKLARNGAYSYVIRGADGTAASISGRINRLRKRAGRSKKVADPFSFKMYGYSFPLRGSHSYGDGIGAGRGHQGVDVLAKCGTPIVAARGGTVYYNDYQAGGAGNYLVINIRGAKGRSQVYMHMPRRSKFKVGQKVKTGQKIGVVGSTGRSTACHLHFEQWTGPGWYQGGTFMNPWDALHRWDRYS